MRPFGESRTWSEDEMKRLMHIAATTPMRSGRRSDIKTIYKRYNDGLSEAYTRNEDQVMGMLRRLRDRAKREQQAQLMDALKRAAELEPLVDTDDPNSEAEEGAGA